MESDKAFWQYLKNRVFGTGSKSALWGRHTASKGGVRLFVVPESGKDIFSLLTSPELDIKLNQNSKSSCTSQN